MEKAVNILFIACLTAMIIGVLLSTVSAIFGFNYLLSMAIQVILGLGVILALVFLLLVGIVMTRDSQ